MTVVITIARCGDILSTIATFTGKFDRTIKDPTVCHNLFVVTKEQPWMDECLMMVWHEQI